MRRVLALCGVFLLLFSFAVVSQGILRVTMMELRLQITRDQLLNYELSSRMLKARFRQMARKRSDDIGAEMKMKVLESSVLNSRQDTSTVKLDWLERMGVWTVNGIRRISLKTPIALEEDRGRLVLLEYAFFQERQRNFEQASKAYMDLEKASDSAVGENQAFALLHHGYCLALLGNVDPAKERLTTVRDTYRGSHYAENAMLLLSMLSEGEENEKKIKESFTDDRDRAKAFYSTGQFALAAKTFDTIQRLDTDETYMHGRSLEETGQTDKAVAKFNQLVGQGDAEVQKKANRRLLMIGNFYGGGKAVAEKAEKKAVEIGDKETIAQVKETAVLAEKPTVLEKLRDEPKLAERVASIERIREEMEVEAKKQEEPAKVEEKPPVVIARPEPPKSKPKTIILELIDGRVMKATGLTLTGNSVEVKRGGFPVIVPMTMIKSIFPEEEQGVAYSERDLIFILKDGSEKRAGAYNRDKNKSVIFAGSEEIALPEEDIAEIRLP